MNESLYKTLRSTLCADVNRFPGLGQTKNLEKLIRKCLESLHRFFKEMSTLGSVI